MKKKMLEAVKLSYVYDYDLSDPVCFSFLWYFF